MEARSIMTPDPVTVTPDTTLDRAIELMDEHAIRHLPVLEDGRLVGIVTDHDLLGATGWLPRRVHAARGPGDHAPPATVREIMNAPVVHASPRESLVTAAIDIVVRGIGCLPIVEDDRLIGILTEVDLLQAYVEACAERRLTGDLDPPVEQYMTRGAVTLEADRPIGEADELRRSIDVRHVPVTHDGRLVGILSARDLRRAAGAGFGKDRPVREFMTAPAATIAKGRPLSQAARRMVEHRFSALPVVADEELVGIVSTTDLLDHCMNTLREPESGGPP